MRACVPIVAFLPHHIISILNHPYAYGRARHAVRQALDRLVALNNLAACARYTEKLRRELVAEVPSIFQDDPPTQQLMVGGST